MTEETLQSISNKLSLIATLLMDQQSEDIRPGERIRMLNNFGLSNNEIASILGMSKHAVEMAQSRLRHAVKGATRG